MIISKFIQLCRQYPATEWAEKRKFDIQTLNLLGIGICNSDVMSQLQAEVGLDVLKENGFISKNGTHKYLGRVIIPHGDNYFSARKDGDTYKNLFPKGMTRLPWIIEGTNKEVWVVEGEPDAIRVKHQFNHSWIYCFGGTDSTLIKDKLKVIVKENNFEKIILCFDNDEPGKDYLKKITKLLSKDFYCKNKIVVCQFDESQKDIDDYFKAGGTKENLKFVETNKPAESTEQQNGGWGIYNKEQPIKLVIDNYKENSLILYNQSPYFYDKNEIWWRWTDFKWEMVDDIDMSMLLDEKLGFAGQTISGGVRNNYLEAMRWTGREKRPKDAKVHWIQFRDKAFSLTKKVMYDVKPNYFFTNPIPHDLAESEETPVMDKLFEEWVGKDYVQDLYEIIAYCTYPAYPIQTLFCLIGAGRNGKSSFLKIVNKFLGPKNICSTELDLITGNNSSRFETIKLYKKLVCLMGETNFGSLNKSSIIKKLTGGDLIGYEMKGKQPFDDYNYAKIIIASNSLPITKDTSEGFYRRWHIIEFANQFPEGKDICESIPCQEYSNLARKCVNLLPKLLERGNFTHQGTPEERTNKYIMASNPLSVFIKERCEVNESYFVLTSELYTAYLSYLHTKKSRKISRKDFMAAMEDEGYWSERTSKNIGKDEKGYNLFKVGNWIDGLRLKLYDVYDVCRNIYPQKTSLVGQVEKVSQTSQTSQKDNFSVLKINEPTTPEVFQPFETIQPPPPKPQPPTPAEVRQALMTQLNQSDMVERQQFVSQYPEQFQMAVDVLIDKMKEVGDCYEPIGGMLRKL